MSLRDELLRRFPALTRVPPGSYAVGGAVRDLLLGRDPADVDVAAFDPLAAARAVSPRTIRLGDQEHLSAWRVVRDGHVYDFAALLDGELAADLGRRDFTVNAMAVDLTTGELSDPHHGRDDLAARIVRMVAASNFDDDPLRVLKGVRVAVARGFEIEPATLSAMRERAPRIVEIAAERVGYELSLILGAGALQRAVTLLRDAALDGPLGLSIPELHAGDVSLAGAYALLVADPRAYAKRWRWSQTLLRDVLALQELASVNDRMALFDAGEDVSRQLPGVLRARGASGELDLPDFSIRPLLDGGDIAAMTGLAPGKDLGRIKRALLEAQVRGEVTTREEAEEWVRTRNAER